MQRLHKKKKKRAKPGAMVNKNKQQWHRKTPRMTTAQPSLLGLYEESQNIEEGRERPSITHNA